MEKDCGFANLENKYSFKFKEKQKVAVESILDGKDTFIVLPTGYGKSKIYWHLPEMYELTKYVNGTVLVISPIQALMLDQVVNLERLGIRSTLVGECQKDKGIATKIMEGEFSIVFSSPEAALTPGPWRRSFIQGAFHDSLKAVVIDEAHCITEWGAEFRHDYGKLAELRSIVPQDTTFVAMTATATKATRADIINKLNMVSSETTTISALPERDNITYVTKKSKKNLQQLQWLLNDVLEYGNKTKKTIVYCRNIASCANLYEYFNQALGQNNTLSERLVAMFHRSTADINKDHVLTEFPRLDSTLRIVFATVAFGMGIDIPDIEQVIHWGAPRGLEQFAQESGRAGRDGRPALSCIYFSGHDIAKGKTTTEVHEYCQSTGCLREVINLYFKLEDSDGPSNVISHNCQCCSFCHSECECGNCISYECLLDVSDNTHVSTDDISVRNLSDQQLFMLKENLNDFKDCLEEENNNDASVMTHTFIHNIICNSAYLMCEEDVMDLGLSSHALAEEILLLIEEIENVYNSF